MYLLPHIAGFKQERCDSHNGQTDCRHDEQIDGQRENRNAQQCAAQPIHTIRQWIQIGQGLEKTRKTLNGKEGAGKEEDGKNHKIHDELKSVHVLHSRRE